MNRKFLWLAGAAGVIAAASTSCGAGGNKVHGVDTADAKAVAGAYVLDLLVCTDASLGRQYDYLAKPARGRAAYVRSMKAACKPRGTAKLEQSVVDESGKTRVVEVRYVTYAGSGQVRVRVTDRGDGYRVDRAVPSATTSAS